MVGINISVIANNSIFSALEDNREQMQNAMEQERKLAEGIVDYNSQESTIDDIEQSNNAMSNQEKEIFNSQFSIYEGLQKGSSVRTLMQRIASSNENTPEHIVKYSDIIIEVSKTYKVSFEKDGEGYINNVLIVEEQ